jgi:glycosyltransferase involved in cell wall biosynthesis
MKSKILFILHYPPPIHGAAMVGQYIRESEIINSAFEGRYINLGTSRSVEEIGKNPAGKIFRYVMLLGRVFKMLVTFKPDVCYLTPSALRLGFYKDAPLITLAKYFNVKVVLQFHNKGITKWKNSVIDKIVCRFIFKNANVILLSKNLYNDVQKYIAESKVYYCANGIPELQATNRQYQDKSEIQDLAPEIRNSQLATRNSTVDILFLSNLTASKGVFVLLEACKILKNKKLPFLCTFVGGIGDVSEAQLISKIQEFDLADYVHYVGKKYGAEKEEALGKADIFVHPTYDDCFPLVLLEAMQHALPIVSTFEGGIADIVEDGITGFLVSQKDIEALANKLEIIINNPQLRKRMGTAGRSKYEQEFTLAIFENRFIDILQDIALKVTK